MTRAPQNNPNEARARLLGALHASKVSAADLSLLAGRDRRYISEFLAGRRELEPEVARALEGMLALGLGALRNNQRAGK